MDNLLKRIIIFKALFLGDAIHNSLLGLESFLFQYNMRTEAEKKEAQAIASKKWKQKNRDRNNAYNKAYRENNKEVLRVKREGKSIVQVTTDILNLMSGSIELSGAGGTIGGTHRDLDLEADSEQELDTFLEMLTNRGYDIA